MERKEKRLSTFVVFSVGFLAFTILSGSGSAQIRRKKRTGAPPFEDVPISR